LPHKKWQEKQTHWNHKKQEGTGKGQQVAEVKESKGLKLSCQLEYFCEYSAVPDVQAPFVLPV